MTERRTDSATPCSRCTELEEKVLELQTALRGAQRVLVSDPPTPRMIERFLAKVDQSAGRDGCHPWLGSERFHMSKRTAIAPRRFTWRAFIGDLPADEIAVTCGNAKCMNPAHLAVSDEQKFWARVKKTDGCWEWQGCLSKNGSYGVFSPRTGVNERAHRYAWELTHGPIGNQDINACHHCDNPRCVRPDHLFLGTDADNIHDMISKGRAAWQRKKAS